MTQNEILHQARTTKNDEFYTQYEDIEDEMQYYKTSFSNKTVYCNCDHPDKSNFVKYFMAHFKEFNLARLIATSHSIEGKGTAMTFDGNNKQMFQLKGNGDFRSDECVNFLEQSDIVVTNPPFSLFRQFMTILMQHDKKFIVIGNKNAISYKEIFPYIKNNQMWIGHRPFSGGMWFEIETPEACKTIKTVNGKLLGNVASCWFTNLPHEGRNKQLQLTQKYSPEQYPKYDNYDAIEVQKTKDIPDDYYGTMGVPITFLDKYNPDQFEILDINPHFYTITEQGLPKPKQLSLKSHGMKDPYARILIKRKPQSDNLDEFINRTIESTIKDILD